jgi:eukaryotic-like serine/threonine-protein kinase
MPHFTRGSLASRIETRPLPLGEVLRLGHGVLTGAAQIHVKGFLHFDLKPTNVLYTDGDVPMIADFGQARKLSPTGVVQMPPMYPTAIPPETYLSGTGSVASDIYQIGLLLYRAVNGDDFYRAQEPHPAVLKDRVIRGRFPDRGRFLPHVPRRLRTLIRKALRADPGTRYQSATEVQDDLSKVEFALDWTAEPLPTAGRQWRVVRADGSKLFVYLLADGARWKTEVYTEASARRAKGRATFWKRQLSLNDAFAHLTQVFQELE